MQWAGLWVAVFRETLHLLGLWTGPECPVSASVAHSITQLPGPEEQTPHGVFLLLPAGLLWAWEAEGRLGIWWCQRPGQAGQSVWGGTRPR